MNIEQLRSVHQAQGGRMGFLPVHFGLGGRFGVTSEDFRLGEV